MSIQDTTMRALSSDLKDSPNAWCDGKDWPEESDHSVVKLVLGTPRGDGVELPIKAMKGFDLLIEVFPNLTHLYLWNLKNLKVLDGLPKGLKCLDVRGCDDLSELGNLPETLEELILWDCPKLELTGRCSDTLFASLRDLSLKRNSELHESWISVVLREAPLIRLLEISHCENLKYLGETWPEGVVDLRLNGNPNLRVLLAEWPPSLRRLELQGSKVSSLSPLPESANYLDFRGMTELKVLPAVNHRPRTLMIHGSGLELRDELFGGKDFNSARYVWAHLEKERVPDHEVKVILLGNGRCGKSSLARKLVKGDFDSGELSTHGIRLWNLERFGFEPKDEPGEVAMSHLRIWDFAGQDLYHHAHRLFYQSKAIFIICDTASGDGADLESDSTDTDGLPPGWDEDRTLGYWRDQVEALGSAPGRAGPPPILFVRTKADRDEEEGAEEKLSSFLSSRGEASKGLDQIDFGAKNGQGVEELRGWIQGKVSEILGERGRREIRKDALGVKNILAEKIKLNDAEHELAENENRSARPPCPLMSRADFDELVREHCHDGAYHEDPGLFLQLLHLSGFLFYNAEFLPGSIVLDQRWAISGIYTAFERTANWQRLVARRGRCSTQDLADWGWDRADFSDAEQKLLRGLMESCGMMFRIGQGQNDAEAKYVIPRALPSYDLTIQRAASDYRGSLEIERKIDLEHKSLSRDAVMDLLVNLAREWGRAPLLWLWGGQFESYRYYQMSEEERGRTFVLLNWTPARQGAFGGTLQLLQYGEDTGFLVAILEQCQKIGGFDQVEIPEIELEDEEPDHEGERLPQKELQSHKPESLFSDCLEVGISFAGDQSGPVADWEDLPADSIERWPLSLAKELRERGIKVEEYRAEQGREPWDQTVNRNDYLDDLISKDFIYAFISWPYLDSPWCMSEFLRLSKKSEGRYNPALASLACFKDAYFSQTDLEQKHPESGENPVVHFTQHWNEKFEQFQKMLEAQVKASREADLSAREKALAKFGYADWMKCVSDADQFASIVEALSGGWKVNPISGDPEPDLLSDWCDRLEKTARRREILFDYAAEAEGAQKYDRAARFFIRAFLGGDPDGQPEGIRKALKVKLGVDVLDNIRRRVLEELDELEEDGEVIDSWQQLEEKIAPQKKSK